MLPSNEENNNVFEKEVRQLEHSKSIFLKSEINNQELKSEFQLIVHSYEQLLEETRLITSVSDRLQNKLNRANDTLLNQADVIQKINNELESNNKALQQTIEELTKARLSRKVATIVLIFTIALFIVSEGLIEPIIEAKIDNSYLGFLTKGFIVLLIKPIEIIVERFIYSRN